MSIPVSKRKPIHAHDALENVEFLMTEQEYLNTFEKLMQTIHGGFTNDDKEFLINFKKGFDVLSNDWLLDFPSVRWKRRNILLLKQNKVLHAEKVENLKIALDCSTDKFPHL